MKDVFKTPIIPVWDNTGEQISQIVLSEPIIPVFNRRGGFSESGVYYKGAGIIYSKHLSNSPNQHEILAKESNLIYQKYEVINSKNVGKFGIFTFPHQPIFTDYEGGCGPKEHKLIENFQKFERTNILEIVDVIDIGLDNHKIYAYKTKQILSNASCLLELFEYILTENWNTAWDKDVWSDIVQYGYVRDIADWFISSEFSHKLGTIYGILSSLYKADKYTYTFILSKLFGYNYFSQVYIPYIAALIVQKFCPGSVPDLDLENITPNLYKRILTKIYTGKACCHLECEDKWAWVKSAIMDRYLDSSFKAFQYELYLSAKRNKKIKKIKDRASFILP